MLWLAAWARCSNPFSAGGVISFCKLDQTGLPEVNFVGRDDSDSVRSFVGGFPDPDTDDNQDRRRSIVRAANAIAATDYDYHAITDGCAAESVASSDSRPNSIV